MVMTIRRFSGSFLLLLLAVLLPILSTTIPFARAEQPESQSTPTTTPTSTAAQTPQSQTEAREEASSFSSSSYISNPIQVRFESFSIEIGPTNNARPLSIRDADTILGMIEDLITNFAREHYYHNNNIVISTTTTTTTTSSTANTISSLRARGEESNEEEVVEKAEEDEDEESILRTAAEHRNGGGGGGENSDDDGMEFKYAILGLVSIARHPEEYKSRTTTTLDFPTGGIAYFGGGGGGGGYGTAGRPTTAEVQMLVTLALNEGDLVDALQTEFPYITEATYRRSSSEEEDFNNNEEEDEQEEEGDPKSDDGDDSNNNDATASDLMGNTPISSDSEHQFMIIVISACGAALVFCMLLVVLYLIRQRQRRVFWREDNHRRNSNNHNNSNSVKSPLPVPQRDAALDHDDSSLDCSYPNNKKTPTSKRFSLTKSEAKQQSLHLRDSLRGMTIMQDQDVNDLHLFGDSPGAAATASCGAEVAVDGGVGVVGCSGGGDLEKEKPPRSPQQGGNVMNLNVDTSGDQDTSSCSLDGSSNDSVHNDKEYDTCPSDFEGNAIVKPNLLPVTNLDRFSNDDPHNPLPPSQSATARHDDSLIELSAEEVADPTPASPAPASAPFPAGPTFSPNRPKSTQEGFLAKYFNPILPLGTVGLSYFSSTTHDEEEDEEDDGHEADCEAPYYRTPRYKRQDHLTPRTAASTLSPPPGDQDSRWSDVSSDYKTDDDFELDRAWDPDDTSVTSSADGKDIFSPCSSDDNDEVKLLDSLGSKQGTYNLHKLRTPTKPKPDANRNTQNVGDTEAI